MVENNKILIVDDNEDIHCDFKKILGSINNINNDELDDIGKELFGENSLTDYIGITPETPFDIHHAYSGEEAIEMVSDATDIDTHFGLIFLDIRMPPGMNGIETAVKIWEIDPNIELVLCTAYADFRWLDIQKSFGLIDNLIYLKKPFHPVEIRQLVTALLQKWQLKRDNLALINQLEQRLKERTSELEEALEELEQINNH